MKLNIAIIEDEPATARNLSYLIKETDSNAEILTILNSVTTAIEWLKENEAECDLLFMDIRLGDGLSFEIIEAIHFKTPVIFVTAYNEYALKAFKANGIHYILKPFAEEDVAEALQKYKNIAGNKDDVAYKNLLQTIQHLQTANNYKRSLLVHFRDKLIPLNIADIVFFYSKNEVMFAYTSDKKYVTEGNLDKMLTELDPAKFFRANRQFIINYDAIIEAHFYFNGRLLLKTNPEPPEPILISKARVPEFKTWMNK